MRRRQDCLLATHPGAVVLHSKRRPRVVLSLFVCTPHSTLIFHLSRFRIALLPPHISHLPILELASELTQINAESRRPPPTPSSVPPPPFLMSRQAFYVHSRSCLIPAVPALYCTFPLFLHSSHSGYSPITLLAPRRNFPYPSHPSPSPPPFLRHLSNFSELSIHYSIRYLICVCCLFCSLPYPLFLVGCRGSWWKQDSLWIPHPPCSKCIWLPCLGIWDPDERIS